MSKYDLEDFLDDAPKTEREKIKESGEDPRPNLHIARSCKNCKYFWYENSSRPYNGFCKLPEPEKKAIYRKGGEAYDVEEIKRNWLRVHMTCLCDNHTFRSEKFCIDPPANWVGIPFNPDGSKMELD